MQEPEKEVVKTRKVEMQAIRKLFVEYTPAELNKLQGDDKKGRDFNGIAKEVQPGSVFETTKEMAKHYQESGLAKVVIK